VVQRGRVLEPQGESWIQIPEASNLRHQIRCIYIWKTNTIPILMHQMRILINQVFKTNHVMLRQKKLEIREKKKSTGNLKKNSKKSNGAMKLSQIHRRIELCLREIILRFEMNLWNLHFSWQFILTLMEDLYHTKAIIVLHSWWHNLRTYMHLRTVGCEMKGSLR
jgi:hypothetical protein